MKTTTINSLTASSADISRRSALTLGGAAIAATALSTDGRAQGSSPKRGGVLRLGLAGGGPSDTLDPGKLFEPGAGTVSCQCRNTLVEMLPNLRPAPELAESWEASPDAKVWTFKLRQGVEFHNGKTFDAEDVIFNLNYHRDPKSGSAAHGFVRPIADVKADGKYRVVVTLKESNADFPALLSEYRLAMMPAGTTDHRTAIGTGPYVVKTFDPGVKAHAVKNPNYFSKDRGFVDEVHTIVLNDTAARTNALLSGQVDVINRVDLRTIDALKGNSSITVRNDQGFRFWTMPMFVDTPPFDNLDFRTALKLAIDREEILDKVLNGYGTVGNDLPLTPRNRYFNSEIPQRKLDLDRAKYHINKSGHANANIELHCSEASFEGAIDASILYQQSLSKVGINLKLTRHPTAGFFSNVWRKQPFLTSFTRARSTEDAIFSLNHANNESHWQNERWTSLLQAARGELNETKRREMYFEMQRLWWETGGIIVPNFINNVSASTSKVKAPAEISPVNELDDWRVAQRWWLV